MVPDRLETRSQSDLAANTTNIIWPTDPCMPITATPGCNQPTTSRTLLSRIAWLSDEILRTSEEKVHLAQASCDSVSNHTMCLSHAPFMRTQVDRHIRILDQAIQEQEAAIALGPRPGGHPAPILLPDLVVPRWARSSRVTLSPMPDLLNEANGDEPMVDDQGSLTANNVSSLQNASADPASQRYKSKKNQSKRPKESKVETAAEIAAANPETSRRISRSLRLVASQPPAIVLPPDMVIDPKEPRYCYCNQVSYGEACCYLIFTAPCSPDHIQMIGCDKPGCKREWVSMLPKNDAVENLISAQFHLACAGFAEAPKKMRKWYCRDCSRRR
jgi:hypothetical protein